MKLLIGFAALLALTGGQPPAPEAPAASGTLLIGNKGEDTVSFVDLATGRELGRAATGRLPHEIAISPDGREAAVVSYGARGIDIFDIATRARLRTIDLTPNDGPHGIAWLPDGRIVATTERSQSIAIVDTRNDDAVSAIATGQEGTHMIAVSPDGRTAYTANMRAGTVSVIDLAGGRLIRNFRVGGVPEGIALSPDGATLWVGDNEGAVVQAFDTALLATADTGDILYARLDVALADGSEEELRAAVLDPLAARLIRLPGVTQAGIETDGANTGRVALLLQPGTDAESLSAAVAAATREVGEGRFPQGRTAISFNAQSAPPIAIVRTGAVPIRVLASPDGRWVVTSNMGAGSLTLIDAESRFAVREIDVGGDRQSGQVTILFSADGRRLYAAETGRDQIAEVDVASGQVRRRLPAGRNGDGLAITP